MRLAVENIVSHLLSWLEFIHGNFELYKRVKKE